MTPPDCTAPRVSIVAPMLARHDAISRAAVDTGRAVARSFGAEARYFTYRCDFPELRATIVRSVTDVLSDPAFQASDIIIYHFGIYAELIDALIVGAPGAAQIVRFHNVTPPELVPESERTVLVSSWEQAHLLRDADLIWADSEVNAEVAQDLGVDPARIAVIPLAVDFPEVGRLARKPLEVLELLFVGRIVPSKGVLDLLEAVAQIVATPGMRPVRLRIVGSTEWSPPGYVASVQEGIARRGLDEIIELVGSVDAAELADYYARAHCFVLPSYHEGFCKPVIEALRAGCVPITYDAHNLRHIAGGHGRTTPTGDADALCDAISDVIQGLSAGEVCTDAGRRPLANHDAAVAAYVESFTFPRFAERIGRSISALRPAAIS